MGPSVSGSFRYFVRSIKRLASEAFGEPEAAVCLNTGITPGFSAKSLPEGVGGGGRGSKG